MSQIAMFGLTILLGIVFGFLLKLIGLFWHKMSTLTRVVVDFFSYGICILLAGILMQVFNHKVSFYLYCGLIFGVFIVFVLFSNLGKSKKQSQADQTKQVQTQDNPQD